VNISDKKSALGDHLRRAVITLAQAPGAALDEAAFCAAFDLSRTPAREVFRDLAGEGYLDLTGRGARVSDLSHRSLREFFLVAPMIYEAVLRLAAENATEMQVARLRSAQEVFCTALRDGPVADRALSNTRFHEITGEMAGNRYLMPSFRRLLIDHARIGMTFYQPRDAAMSDRLDAARQQHEAMIDAIAARDADAAARLAQAHWALSRSEIERFVLPPALDAPLGSLSEKRFA
jgi:DNA-binding GntR family transcriptional regulator